MLYGIGFTSWTGLTQQRTDWTNPIQGKLISATWKWLVAEFHVGSLQEHQPYSLKKRHIDKPPALAPVFSRILQWNSDLVGGFKDVLWDVILPIDELIFFKMVIAPPTRDSWITCWWISSVVVILAGADRRLGEASSPVVRKADRTLGASWGLDGYQILWLYCDYCDYIFWLYCDYIVTIESYSLSVKDVTAHNCLHRKVLCRRLDLLILMMMRRRYARWPSERLQAVPVRSYGSTVDEILI